MKTCSKCNIEKEFSEFGKGNCKDGWIGQIMDYMTVH